jgi:hypothetical protein
MSSTFLMLQHAKIHSNGFFLLNTAKELQIHEKITAMFNPKYVLTVIRWEKNLWWEVKLRHLVTLYMGLCGIN